MLKRLLLNYFVVLIHVSSPDLAYLVRLGWQDYCIGTKSQRYAHVSLLKSENRANRVTVREGRHNWCLGSPHRKIFSLSELTWMRKRLFLERVYFIDRYREEREHS